jgi:hypothetical protein
MGRGGDARKDGVSASEGEGKRTRAGGATSMLAPGSGTSGTTAWQGSRAAGVARWKCSTPARPAGCPAGNPPCAVPLTHVEAVRRAAGEGVVRVVPALPEADERHPPVVAAEVACEGDGRHTGVGGPPGVFADKPTAPAQAAAAPGAAYAQARAPWHAPVHAPVFQGWRPHMCAALLTRKVSCHPMNVGKAMDHTMPG